MGIPPLVPSQSCCARQLPQRGAKGLFRKSPIVNSEIQAETNMVSA